MNDEPSFKTKTEVLDLIISFLMDHEKQMDQMLQRLERMAETLSKGDRPLERAPTPHHPNESQPDSLSITITNLSKLDVKTLKIELGAKHGSITDVDRS